VSSLEGFYVTPTHSDHVTPLPVFRVHRTLSSLSLTTASTRRFQSASLAESRQTRSFTVTSWTQLDRSAFTASLLSSASCSDAGTERFCN